MENCHNRGQEMYEPVLRLLIFVPGASLSSEELCKFFLGRALNLLVALLLRGKMGPFFLGHFYPGLTCPLHPEGFSAPSTTINRF